ncbi:MAG TPA: type II CAAX endopeptidase family protein [Candidatus Thermoplasmatota archaeon]|nr:type II CAAX endopeptidase family protein [Candidatus Thermoplasmatota archaeon]
MDFNIKKPTHLFALLGVLGTLMLFVGYPLISLFSSVTIPSIYTPSMTSFQKLTLEISLLFVQFLFVFAGLIFVPIVWYKLVNKISLKEMFARLQLRREGLDNALLWGVITIVVAFAITMVIGLLYMFFTKIDPSKLSNIPDLEQLFSIPSLYLLVIIQPFCEEFFFRGFLLEKITKFGGSTLAIIITAFLFGMSHLSYTYAYAAVIAVILGVLFAVVVLKTKNLYASIFAHTIINIVSLTLYVFGKSLGM